MFSVDHGKNEVVTILCRFFLPVLDIFSNKSNTILLLLKRFDPPPNYNLKSFDVSQSTMNLFFYR